MFRGRRKRKGGESGTGEILTKLFNLWILPLTYIPGVQSAGACLPAQTACTHATDLLFFEIIYLFIYFFMVSVGSQVPSNEKSSTRVQWKTVPAPVKTIVFFGLANRHVTSYFHFCKRVLNFLWRNGPNPIDVYGFIYLERRSVLFPKGRKKATNDVCDFGTSERYMGHATYCHRKCVNF